MTTSNSDTTSVIPPTSFEDLIDDQKILEALKRLGISKPTDVQRASIPHAMQGHDLIVQAQTGSGKTLAYVLPILTRIRSFHTKHVTTALIITPTRELALQVKGVIESVAPDVKPACIIGGENMQVQVKAIRADCRIIVGTPGRLLDMLQQREILLRKCTQFVLDEADEMLSMGFVEEVRAILSRLPSRRQGLFYSATITPRVKMLTESFLRDPNTIIVESQGNNILEITHCYCPVDGELTAKARALCSIIESECPKSAIVFCNTKSDTELVEVFLRRRGYDASRINSDLSQKDRVAVMNKIHSGNLRILIATDVAARGIDIEKLDLVINYSIHEQPEIYVHRTGRTGRAGRSGRAISLVGPQDFSAFRDLRRAFDLKMQEMRVPVMEQRGVA